MYTCCLNGTEPSGRWVRLMIVMFCFWCMGGCHVLVFDFSREDALNRGDVAGHVVQNAQTRTQIPYARVDGIGARRVQTSRIDGYFRLEGLELGHWFISVTADQDGDGIADFFGLHVADMVADVHTDTYLLAESQDRVGIQMGRIEASSTVELSGRVSVEDGANSGSPFDLGFVGRVFAYRAIGLQGEGAEEVYTLPAEAWTSVDAEGNFHFPAIGRGEVQLVAALYELDQSGQPHLGTVAHIHSPQSVEINDNVDTQDLTISLNPPTGSLETRDVAFRLQPGAAESIYFIFTPPGTSAPPCSDAPWVRENGDQVFETFPDAFPSRQVESAATVQVNAPLGVWDIVACEGVSSFESRPHLFSQVIPADDSAIADIYLAGPIQFIDEPTCAGTALGGPGEVDTATTLDRLTSNLDGPSDAIEAESFRDCDRDGLVGLPVFPELGGPSDLTIDIWTQCSVQCEQLWGSALARASCRHDEGIFDCDDDGDGQPDVTEEQACYGIGKGTDHDGDGLCSVADPFPFCDANRAETCAADVLVFSPRVPEAYGGVAVNDGDGGQAEDGPDGGETPDEDGGTSVDGGTP